MNQQGMPELASVPHGKAILLGYFGENPTKTLSLFTGVPQILYFTKTEEVQHYLNHMMSVKDAIENLNYLVENEHISRDDYIDRIKNDWLMGVVKRFIDEYGLEKVPVDIRKAITNVSENVGELIVPEWPEVNYIPITRDSNPQSPYDYIHM